MWIKLWVYEFGISSKTCRYSFPADILMSEASGNFRSDYRNARSISNWY